MSYRFMRVLVFFDLPVQTAAERRIYAQFRKHLIKNGYMMLQESVYCKLAPNQTVVDAQIDNLRKNKPPAGIVEVLTITEKQFARMEMIVGSRQGDIVNTAERYVEL